MEDLGQIELNPMAFKMLLIESVVVFRTLLVTGQPEYSDELVWNPLRLGGGFDILEEHVVNFSPVSVSL